MKFRRARVQTRSLGTAFAAAGQIDVEEGFSVLGIISGPQESPEALTFPHRSRLRREIAIVEFERKRWITILGLIRIVTADGHSVGDQ